MHVNEWLDIFRFSSASGFNSSKDLSHLPASWESNALLSGSPMSSGAGSKHDPNPCWCPCALIPTTLPSSVLWLLQLEQWGYSMQSSDDPFIWTKQKNFVLTKIRLDAWCLKNLAVKPSFSRLTVLYWIGVTGIQVEQFSFLFCFWRNFMWNKTSCCVETPMCMFPRSPQERVGGVGPVLRFRRVLARGYGS